MRNNSEYVRVCAFELTTRLNLFFVICEWKINVLQVIFLTKLTYVDVAFVINILCIELVFWISDRFTF